jgi:hypothetical protein
MCDRNGITIEGYGAIYKQFKHGVKAVGRGLRIGCLSKPFHVSRLRTEMNLKLRDYVGDYYAIRNTLEILPGLRAKNKDPERLTLNENNSIFVDVEAVQRTMVTLYGITPLGIVILPIVQYFKILFFLFKSTYNDQVSLVRISLLLY